MTSLQAADPTLAPGSPFLGTAKPAFTLQLLARGVLCAEVRDCERFDAALTRGSFVACREKAGVGGDQPGWPTELLLMDLERRHEQVGVARTFVVDLLVRDDLLLGLLELDQLAELGGLGGLALADDFGVRLE